MTIATHITAGDTLSFTESWTDYLPADGWIVRYVLVSATLQIQIDSSDNGDGTHLIAETAANTAAWAAGDYAWQSYAVKVAERYRLGSGQVVIEPDFAAATSGIDGRSDWQIILDNLLAAYKKLTTTSATVVTVTINNRSTTYRDTADLIAAIQNARQEVGREKQEQALRDGVSGGSSLKFRF